MPCLEHLTVTFERHNSYDSKLERFYQSQNLLNESYVTKIKSTHLRSLILRGNGDSSFSMTDVLCIIRHLQAFKLESLTLVSVETSCKYSTNVICYFPIIFV
jgi:hypothetical protein